MSSSISSGASLTFSGVFSGSAASLGVQAKPTKVADAAQQFEALLIGQIVRSAREASQDGDGDNASETMMDLANQQFAQVLAKNGGVGIAHMIVKGLGDKE